MKLIRKKILTLAGGLIISIVFQNNLHCALEPIGRRTLQSGTAWANQTQYLAGLRLARSSALAASRTFSSQAPRRPTLTQKIKARLPLKVQLLIARNVAADLAPESVEADETPSDDKTSDVTPEETNPPEPSAEPKKNVEYTPQTVMQEKQRIRKMLKEAERLQDIIQREQQDEEQSGFLKMIQSYISDAKTSLQEKWNNWWNKKPNKDSGQ